jgi:hypothetical protein
MKLTERTLSRRTSLTIELYIRITGLCRNSMVIKDGMLEHQMESVNRRSKTVQIVLPYCKVKEVLGELYGRSLGGHLGVNKTLDRIRQWQ